MGGKRALIIGISGQDGAYLARLLLESGFDVVGTSRTPSCQLSNLKAVGIIQPPTVVFCNLLDPASAQDVIRSVSPDLVFNLAGQSSVGLSYEQPLETLSGIISGTVNLLEAIRLERPDATLFNASSSEMFGDTACGPAGSSHMLKPISPYGVAKASAHSILAIYRDLYNIRASSGILFNHESPLRPNKYVTGKIVRHAYAVAHGHKQVLRLGNCDICRDWGLASEYVHAMLAMSQMEQPRDLVIATGTSVSLKYLVKQVYRFFGLSAEDWVLMGSGLPRKADIQYSQGDPTDAHRILGWRAKTLVPELVGVLCSGYARLVHEGVFSGEP